MKKHMVALSALVALLAGSAVGVTAQSPGPEQGVLVTEQVEPGVERIISDGAGHDLEEGHPTNRYDMDDIAITPDGTIWLATTYNRSDNQANPPGELVWALGQPETYTVAEWPRSATSPTYLYLEPNGTRTVVETQIVSSTDGAFIPDVGPVGSHWDTEAQQPVVVARSDGEHTCRNMGMGVTCKDPSGERTTYLSGTPIGRIAAAPDGTIWAVGGYEGANGGLYRITLD